MNEQLPRTPEADIADPGDLFRAIFQSAARIPFTLLVVGCLQGLAMTAIVYLALHWLFREVAATISFVDFFSDLLDHFSGRFPERSSAGLPGTFSGDAFWIGLEILAEQAWTFAQALFFIGATFLAVRSLAKLAVARRTLDLIRGGSGMLAAVGDVVCAWPVYAFSFGVTRMIVFVGLLAFGLPGLALLLLFAVFAPMFASAGPRFGSLLASLDFLNGTRLIALLAAYAVFFVATLALAIAASVASLVLGLSLNAELIATLSAIDYESIAWSFATGEAVLADFNARETALDLALSGAPLWFAFGISDALLTLVAATAFGHYRNDQKDRDSQGLQKSSESEASRSESESESASGGSGFFRSGRRPSPGAGFGGSSYDDSDDSPWS